MLTRYLDRAISLSARRPWVVVAAALMLAVAAGFYAVTAFDMTTDTSELLSPDTDWRQDEERVGRPSPAAARS
jgi:hypothetical protein